jgi:hypothetical protein
MRLPIRDSCEIPFSQGKIEGEQLLFMAGDGAVTIRMTRRGAARWEGQ